MTAPIFISKSNRFGSIDLETARAAMTGQGAKTVVTPAPNPLLATVAVNPAGKSYATAAAATAAQAAWNSQQALWEQMRLDNEKALALAADLERRRAAQWALEHPDDPSLNKAAAPSSSNTLYIVGGVVALIGVGLYWKYG